MLDDFKLFYEELPKLKRTVIKNTIQRMRPDRSRLNSGIRAVFNKPRRRKMDTRNTP